ncbi:hypothetical protein [Vibrio vulnificus]|uniref:hypothetical protein n=1 Tax=Vibrio vulnificus TaxID=672 RepID=UPI0040589D8F
MKYVTMILIFFHLVAGGALAAPDANVVLNTKHKLPVAPEVERFILEGSSSVFIKKGMFGGASTDINYELHNIELMLHKDIPPMFFEIKPEFNCEVRHSPISSNQCHFFKDNRWLLEV